MNRKEKHPMLMCEFTPGVAHSPLKLLESIKNNQNNDKCDLINRFV